MSPAATNNGIAAAGPGNALVIGATGLVGRALMQRLGEGASGTFCWSSSPPAGLFRLDVTAANDVRTLIADCAPRLVYLTAAFTAVDGCEREPERSHAVNVEGARNVAAACAAAGARLIYFSSDYVFGEGGPHALDERPAPMNVYGRHKLEAETSIQDLCQDHVIVRTCNVYGYQPGGKNFAMAVVANANARSKASMRLPQDQWGSPTAAGDLAGAALAAAASRLRGVFHLAGPEYLDRVMWARQILRAYSLPADFLEPVSTSDLGQFARRPLRAGLDSRASCMRLGVQLRGLDEGLEVMRAAERREE